MRNLAVFLIALGLGALTVVGQERSSDDLKKKIDELTRILEERNAQRQPPREGKIELRFYQVADLIRPVTDTQLRPKNLKASRPGEVLLPEPGRWSVVEVDAVIEMIRQMVEPETWDTVEGADIQPKNASIMVTTIPRVHEGIVRLLETLRANVRMQATVDVVAVPVSAELAAALAIRPRELNASEIEMLAKVAPLGRARIVCRNGQQLAQRSGSERGYLADYEVRTAQGAQIGDPVRAQVFEGCGIEVRAALDVGGKGAILHLYLEQTSIKDPMRGVETRHGVIDTPEMQITRVGTALWAPLGKTVVAGGCTTGKHPCVFLVVVSTP
jgi:hypothetical protein